MKKLISLLVISLTGLLFTSSFELSDSNGKAGYTGSPGEATCSGNGSCHGGGTFTSPSVTITATPSFSNHEYLPDSVYTVSVTASATGSNRFGFALEVLDGSNVNSGTLQNPGAGVKQVNLSRTNMTHSTPKVSSNNATFTFKWTAPSAGAGDAIFYTCCNAVNGNNNTSGDLPIPYTYTLTEGTPPPSTLSVNNHAPSEVSNLKVYPNPVVSGNSTISYQIEKISAITLALYDINGKMVKEFYSGTQSPGNYSKTLDLSHVASGVYFVKGNVNGKAAVQKMLIVK